MNTFCWVWPIIQQVKGSDGTDASDSAAIFVEADLADEHSVKKAILQASKAFGGIDGLVNVSPPPCTKDFRPRQLYDLNLEKYKETLALEMHTPLLCAKQVSSVMTNSGGTIVFVVEASNRGLTGGAGNVAAVTALTASAASAGGPAGIRVNCVSHALGSSSEDGGGHEAVPLATMRIPSAEDVAMQVAHLLSDKTAFVTGQVIAADSVRFAG